MCSGISWTGLCSVIAAFRDQTRWFSDHIAYAVFMSWLSFVMSNCDGHWYPWSGVLLDCIDS